MEKEQKPKKQIFKLIAIQPLDCAPCILKNLKNGEIYYFYKGYSIKDDQITFEESLMNDDFYKLDYSDLNISIHTIVGKNGSGKSAIIELLMRVLNNIAYLLHDEEKDPLTTIYPVPHLDANLFYQLNETIYRIHLKKLIIENDVTATVFRMNSNEKKNVIKKHELSFIKKFFYSIVINYSIYAYNENDFGDDEFFDSSQSEGLATNVKVGKGDELWLNNIMHKNDGYSAPIVIHPQRTNGNIDINNEIHLTKSRLISLFVKIGKTDNILKVLNVKNEITKIIFYVDKENPNLFEIKDDASEIKSFLKIIPRNYLFSLDENDKNVFAKFKSICEIILKKWNLIFQLNIDDRSINFDLINDTLEYNYLVYKTMTIVNRYFEIIIPESKSNYHFKGGYSLTKLNGTKLEYEIENHVKAIHEDNSHITLKLKQTLNFIKFTKIIYSKKREIFGKEVPFNKKTEIIEFTPIEFSIQLNKFKKKWGEKSSDILNFMPPPFIKPIIKYKNTKDQNEINNEYPFDYLSSGEKQYIFFITTILYHLRNIESAHKSRTNRRKFENVNLIFEEIELYFHPEMQRTLVDNLLKSLRSMRFDHIKNINICLVTHSPIILSDIPTSNGLFLKDGKQENMIEQTFASNIYSLFRNAFFLEGAPIGEFAVKKIKKLCEKIEKNELPESELYKEIQIIGDPIVKNQVMKLFENRYNTVIKIQKLEEEIKQLKLKLNDQN